MMELVYPEVKREKDVFEVTINYKDHIVDKDEVERTLGYAKGSIPDHFKEMIDDVIFQLPKYCNIRAGYRLLEVEKSVDIHDGLYVGGTFFKMQKIVTSQLRKADKAALFVCTIGSAMENWSRELLENGNHTLSYIVDIIASVTVENITDLLHDHIGQKMLERGLKITNRYSPGYCNWSVSEQHPLFSFLPRDFCGITLTESAMMVPIKSVSGIIGVGSAVRRVDYICDRCGVDDCIYRTSRSIRAEHHLVQKWNTNIK